MPSTLLVFHFIIGFARARNCRSPYWNEEGFSAIGISVVCVWQPQRLERWRSNGVWERQVERRAKRAAPRTRALFLSLQPAITRQRGAAGAC